jgi:hypothetical protein
LIARGTWEVAHPSVYRVVGAAIDWMHRLVAATLWAGERTAVSHRSAARLWGLDAFRDEDAIELTSRRVLSAPTGVTFHRTRSLMKSEVVEHPETGLVVTNVARTIYDLGQLGVAKRERMVDEALRRNMLGVNDLEHVLGLNNTRGRVGAKRLAEWVADRAEYGPTDSDLETDVLAAFRSAGLPAPRRQFRVTQGKRLVARVDLSWPDRRVAVQAHSPTIHRQGKTWEKDQRIENALTALGWKVIKATREGLKKNPGELISAVRRALDLP